MNQAKTPVAVVLGGSGYLDGTEITEAVSTLINMSQNGIDYQCYAPDQAVSPVNHLTGESEGPERNLLVEAARISRGQVKPLAQLDISSHRALVLPGGYGAAKSLSDFALSDTPEVIPELRAAIAGCHEAQKPIVAMCIAPALLAVVLGNQGVTVTIGNDKGTAAKMEGLGAKHQDCAVDAIVVDEAHRLVTTPAYMYDAKPAEVFVGISKAIGQLAKWLG